MIRVMIKLLRMNIMAATPPPHIGHPSATNLKVQVDPAPRDGHKRATNKEWQGLTDMTLSAHP